MTSSGISPLTRARMPRSDPSLFDAPPDRGRSLDCFGPCWVQCVEVSRAASCPCCSGHDGGSRLRRTVIIRSWLSLRRCPGRRPGCWAGVRAEGRRRSRLRGDVDGVDRTGPLRGVRPDRRERCCSFDGLDGAGCRSVRGCRTRCDPAVRGRVGRFRGGDPVRVPTTRPGVCHRGHGRWSATGLRLGDAGIVRTARDVVGMAADDPCVRADLRRATAAGGGPGACGGPGGVHGSPAVPGRRAGSTGSVPRSRTCPALVSARWSRS